MNDQLERTVMDRMLIAHNIDNRSHFRKYEVANLTGIKKQSLDKILARLIQRGWIVEVKGPSKTGLQPERGGIGYLISSKEAANQVLRQTRNRVGFPREIIEEFEEKLFNGNRTVEIKGVGSKRIDNSFNETFNKLHPKTKRKIANAGGLQIKGSNKIWKKMMAEIIPREYAFYKVVYYPYLHRIWGGRMKSNENEKSVPPWSVPNGKKRFWKMAAKQLKNEINEKRDKIRVDLTQKTTRH